jgi:hypothetical protein
MRQWIVGSLFSGALLLLQPPAAAQDTREPDADGDIVVTGNADVERQLTDFVGALTQAPGGGQLSRFETAVCPTVVGIPPAQKDAVVARIRVVAKAAGLAVGGRSCVPNVLLVVTGDKRAFLEGLRRKHSYYFGDMSASAVRRLIGEPGPAAAWQVDGPLRNADGQELSSSAGVAVNRTTRTGSRLSEGARPQFAAAAVVVESKALVGLTTTQLADYAAMRAFTRADPSKLAASAPTILTILEAPMDSEVPITMTSWDLAFLRSFYAAPANLTAASQRSQIRRSVTRELEKPKPGE